MITDPSAGGRQSTLAAIVASALFVIGSAHAAEQSRDDESRIGVCIKRAAEGRSWLEKTLWGLRDQEGGWLGAQISNKDGSHDLGPLQVNSWWVGRVAKLVNRPPIQVRHWLVHDPCFNVEVAKWIFLSDLASTRSYWKAVGSYHSPTPSRQYRYASNVADRLIRRFGPQLFRSVKISRGLVHPVISGETPMEGRGE